MRWFSNLKIQTKYNIIVSFILMALLGINALSDYVRQQSLVTRSAVDNARSLAKQIVETRDYMSSVVRGEPEHNYSLVPQVVATQVAKRITTGSNYYVRQVSLRYRNPDNRPDPYESTMLRRFAGEGIRETYEIQKIEGIKYFRYLLVMHAEESCLECHGRYEKAPRFVQERFPPGHYSYNYKLGEVIGAVSVRIPLADLYKKIGLNLKRDLAVVSGVFLLLILLMGALIRRAIIDPVKTVSSAISSVTVTGNFKERISVARGSSDEIGELVTAFNQLMEEMDRKTKQSHEAEERYRKLIEIARSAVVSFMEDGKIIIANKRAEQLLGVARQDMLGVSIFDFIEEGNQLREGIGEFIRTGKGGGIGETQPLRVRSVTGKIMPIEMALSVSWSEDKAIFTAILREQGD
ncbi:MAG: DUF3365 domain-containing protein [Geobacter sp.]|nr:DUF3365 domain-containing protein [Geobacter sp.]